MLLSTSKLWSRGPFHVQVPWNNAAPPLSAVALAAEDCHFLPSVESCHGTCVTGGKGASKLSLVVDVTMMTYGEARCMKHVQSHSYGSTSIWLTSDRFPVKIVFLRTSRQLRGSKYDITPTTCYMALMGIKTKGYHALNSCV